MRRCGSIHNTKNPKNEEANNAYAVTKLNMEGTQQYIGSSIQYSSKKQLQQRKKKDNRKKATAKMFRGVAGLNEGVYPTLILKGWRQKQ